MSVDPALALLEGKNGRVRPLEKSLGIRWHQGLVGSRHEGRLEIPVIGDLMGHMKAVVESFHARSKAEIMSSAVFKDTVYRIFESIGPRMWPRLDEDLEGQRFNWLASANRDSLDGHYPRDLYYAVDHDKLRDTFYALLATKCINAKPRESTEIPQGPRNGELEASLGGSEWNDTNDDLIERTEPLGHPYSTRFKSEIRLDPQGARVRHGSKDRLSGARLNSILQEHELSRGDTNDEQQNASSMKVSWRPANPHTNAAAADDGDKRTPDGPTENGGHESDEPGRMSHKRMRLDSVPGSVYSASGQSARSSSNGKPAARVRRRSHKHLIEAGKMSVLPRGAEPQIDEPTAIAIIKDSNITKKLRNARGPNYFMRSGELYADKRHIIKSRDESGNELLSDRQQKSAVDVSKVDIAKLGDVGNRTHETSGTTGDITKKRDGKGRWKGKAGVTAPASHATPKSLITSLAIEEILGEDVHAPTVQYVLANCTVTRHELLVLRRVLAEHPAAREDQDVLMAVLTGNHDEIGEDQPASDVEHAAVSDGRRGGHYARSDTPSDMGFGSMDKGEPQQAAKAPSVVHQHETVSDISEASTLIHPREHAIAQSSARREQVRNGPLPHRSTSVSDTHGSADKAGNSIGEQDRESSNRSVAPISPRPVDVTRSVPGARSDCTFEPPNASMPPPPPPINDPKEGSRPLEPELAAVLEQIEAEIDWDGAKGSALENRSVMALGPCLTAADLFTCIETHKPSTLSGRIRAIRIEHINPKAESKSVMWRLVRRDVVGSADSWRGMARGLRRFGRLAPGRDPDVQISIEWWPGSG
ncbi:hypothetical protein LTR53_012545 [Teratosphaeriaceae sp. CCFEE 6253]|nr:hypothetical protein LTR53_012545 [Teratosphaeriaceae sp. CCFEE 6253]